MEHTYTLKEIFFAYAFIRLTPLLLMASFYGLMALYYWCKIQISERWPRVSPLDEYNKQVDKYNSVTIPKIIKARENWVKLRDNYQKKGNTDMVEKLNKCIELFNKLSVTPMEKVKETKYPFS